jgi:hypothetical protein
LASAALRDRDFEMGTWHVVHLLRHDIKKQHRKNGTANKGMIERNGWSQPFLSVMRAKG